MSVILVVGRSMREMDDYVRVMQPQNPGVRFVKVTDWHGFRSTGRGTTAHLIGFYRHRDDWPLINEVLYARAVNTVEVMDWR